MRIDQRAPLVAAGAAQSQRRAGAAGERFAPGHGPGRPGAAAPAAGLATVDALLALQGEEGPGERRRRRVQRGHDLLDGLDRLRAALLGGGVTAGEARRLAAGLAAEAAACGDPGLDAVVAQIELRAAVELAKLEAR